MFKSIYSVSGIIDKDVESLILQRKNISLKDILSKYVIPGTKIEWNGQKRKFKVIARNDNFIIIARPYNPKRTFEYSIFDLEYMKCNHDNYYTKYDYSNKEECEIALKELQETRDEEKRTHIANDCGLEISRRGPVDIEDVVTEILIDVRVKRVSEGGKSNNG